MFYREDCKVLLLVEILDCLSHETLIVLLRYMWIWKLTNSITRICFDYQCYDVQCVLDLGLARLVNMHSYILTNQRYV